MKIVMESYCSGKDTNLRFLNHVHYEARLLAGQFYDNFKNKKGYKIPLIDILGDSLAEIKESSQIRLLTRKKVRRKRRRRSIGMAVSSG